MVRDRMVSNLRFSCWLSSGRSPAFYQESLSKYRPVVILHNPNNQNAHLTIRLAVVHDCFSQKKKEEEKIDGFQHVTSIGCLWGRASGEDFVNREIHLLLGNEPSLNYSEYVTDNFRPTWGATGSTHVLLSVSCYSSPCDSKISYFLLPPVSLSLPSAPPGELLIGVASNSLLLRSRTDLELSSIQL